VPVVLSPCGAEGISLPCRISAIFEDNRSIFGTSKSGYGKGFQANVNLDM
jgi:hypothetical protein